MLAHLAHKRHDERCDEARSGIAAVDATSSQL